MFLRLGVYQDLCREHAKSSVWMLNRARNQSSFLQGWGNIISLSEGVHHPPPVASSRILVARSRGPHGGTATWSPLSPIWLSFVGSVEDFLSSHSSGWWWSEPLAEPEAAWAVGSMVPSACKTLLSQSKKKIPHPYTSRRSKQQLLCWETIFLWNEKQIGVPLCS